MLSDDPRGVPGSTRPSGDELRSGLVGMRDDVTLGGASFADAWTALVDDWLARLVAQEWPADASAALIALGGHGRRELAPGSDLDLMVLLGRRSTPELAERIWYPLWDSGLKVGHSVRTVEQALQLVETDLTAAAAALDARWIAGDRELSGRFVEGAASRWTRGVDRWCAEIAADRAQRAAYFGDVAFDLEPDLKEGRGGLRDAHCVGWLARGGITLSPVDRREVDAAATVLRDVRVAVHRVTTRGTNRLLLQDQDDVAALLAREHGSSERLMAAVAASARTIAWLLDDLISDVVDRDPFRPVVEREDPLAVLWVATEAASTNRRLDRRVLAAIEGAALPRAPWDDEARRQFIALLACGAGAVPVIEALDRANLMVRLLPEWRHTTSRPQRNAFHRWTVDRHLLETVAVAATLTAEVTRPDLLLVAALLHDIGKGLGGDHSVTGSEMAHTAALRMGFSEPDAGTIAALVADHLLLAEVATRRDLDDPATIRHVTARVGDRERLDLLVALSEADGRATGPASWGSAKASLIRDLATRVSRRLDEGPSEDEPAVSLVALWAARGIDAQMLTEAAHAKGAVTKPDGERLLVACVDRAGLFARVAGVLALNGVDVSAASAAVIDGIAVEELHVSGAFDRPIDWQAVRTDLDAALEMRLALAARLADRAALYRSGPQAAERLAPRVSIDAPPADHATVVEVAGADSIGLLHRLTMALAEVGCDIRGARIATLGADVVDTFYVVDAAGMRITDPRHLGEIERAVGHAIGAS